MLGALDFRGLKMLKFPPAASYRRVAESRGREVIAVVKAVNAARLSSQGITHLVLARGMRGRPSQTVFVEGARA